MWLDHSKLASNTSIVDYLEARPTLLPHIPMKYRREVTAPNEQSFLTSKQIARQSALEGAAADIATVAQTMLAWAKTKRLNSASLADQRSIQEITDDFQVNNNK